MLKKIIKSGNEMFRVDMEIIANMIFIIRGQKVLIDKDLAELYAVETKNLNRQVKRNIERFPDEFIRLRRIPRVAS